ncbi:kinase-like domain-containing protein [Leptodontidium sp. 2 PMI_412]|nr:kinase-like domain-containing protein [Leptodontidium sp. 2 PMI_412]
MLPSDSSVVFKESTYFSENGANSSLPSPAEVRSAQTARHLSRSMTVRFEDLKLVVKYGEEITIAEALCLWAIRQLLPHQIPVPEVYGWCEDGGDFFIYMELIQGETLENKWESLSKPERIDVCGQLRAMLSELRSLKQDPENQFLGHINRQPLLDIMFTDDAKPPAGPFSSVSEFHNWLSFLIRRGVEKHWPDPSLIPDPFRDSLPDDSPITFTHADLHPSNILVTSDAPYRIVAIIDWHQSGWYPHYWEYCKATYTADYRGEWNTQYIPRFVDIPECFDAWSFYAHSLGC